MDRTELSVFYVNSGGTYLPLGFRKSSVAHIQHVWSVARFILF